MMKKAPLIGITMSHSIKNGSPYDYVNRSYLNAVEMAGGIPVPLPNIPASLGIVRMCDGVIFTGGGDVHPKHYGEELNGTAEDSIEEDRDRIEKELFIHAKDVRMPVLGICRGIQSIAVFAGGTLIQDISSHKTAGVEKSGFNHRQAEDRHQPSHQIKIERGTKLFGIQGKETRNVNSLHHQAVKRIPEGWVVSALAEDGIIEAIEQPAQPFMLAVQWHPEELAAGNADDRKLFEALVSEAVNRAAPQN